MGGNRLFLVQALLDEWLSEDRATVEGDVLVTKPGGQRFALTTAVLFKAEVASGEDPEKLVGKVLDLEQLAELGAEHYADSVVYGEHAYEVAEGFAATPELGDDGKDAAGQGPAVAEQALSAFLGGS